MLNGDGELVWGPDPQLTSLGEAQAVEAHQAWKRELPFGVPLPVKCFCSPLKRALTTWQKTFDYDGEERVLDEEKKKVVIVEVRFPHATPARPLISVQNCREEYGSHTCDMRSTLTHLTSLYPPPVYTFEDGFAETDPLWTEERETVPQCISRARKVLYQFRPWRRRNLGRSRQYRCP